MDTVVNKGGRPPTYTNASDLKKAIDEYFANTKTPVYNKDGEIVDYKQGPYTLSGLGRAIGISRITLLRYEAKDAEMNAVIADARQRVEEYVESRLFDKEGSNGAKFALSNNHEGWADRQEITNTHVLQLPPPEEFDAMMDRLIAHRQARISAKAADSSAVDAQFEVVSEES